MSERSEDAAQATQTRRIRWKVIACAVLVAAGILGWLLIPDLFLSPHLRAARQLLAKRDFRSAYDELERYLDEAPDDGSVRLLAARTARRKGGFGIALRHLARYEERFAANADVALERRLLRLQLGDVAEVDALLALCAKEPSAAETPLILEAIIESSLNRLEASFFAEKAGKGEISVEEHHRAQRAVDQWLRGDLTVFDRTQGIVWRGKLYALELQDPKAIETFREALTVDPNHFTAREYLALQLSSDSPAEAATHFELLLDRDPNNTKLKLALAGVRRSLGQIDLAEGLLDSVLSGTPNHIEALIERGDLALERRQAKSAETWLKRAVQIAPDHPLANLTYSHCLEQLDRDSEAAFYRNKYLAAISKK